MSLDGDNLIWDSEVVIEIKPYNVDETISSLKSDQLRAQGPANTQIQPKRQLPDEDHTLKSPGAGKACDDSIVVVNDVDYENSLSCTSRLFRDEEDNGCADHRGRTLGRSNRVRRCNVDLARIEPCAVPRSSAREQSRENRTAVRREIAHHNHSDVHDPEIRKQKRRGIVFAELKRLGQNVRDTISRSRSRYRNSRVNRFNETDDLGEEVMLPLIQFDSNSSSVRMKSVDNMQEMDFCYDPELSLCIDHSYSMSKDITRQKGTRSPVSSQSTIYDTAIVTRADHRQVTPWQQHLDHDLMTELPSAQRRKKSHYLRRNRCISSRFDNSIPGFGMLLNDEVQLQDTSGSIGESSTRSLAHRDIANYWRLPSIQSLPKSASNLSLTRNVSSLGVAERMDEIAPSYEFDQTWWSAHGEESSPSHVRTLRAVQQGVTQPQESVFALPNSPEPGDTRRHAVETPRNASLYLSQSQHSVASILSARQPTGTYSLTSKDLALHSLSTPLSDSDVRQQSSTAETRQGRSVEAWI